MFFPWQKNKMGAFMHTGKDFYSLNIYEHFLILLSSLADPDDPFKLTEDTRDLGLAVCRGTSVVLICPSDGMEAIANPFVQQE